MHFSVARRLQFGFGITCGLLLTISIAASVFISNIQTNSSSVNDVAVPSLISAKELQIEFLNMNDDALRTVNSDSIPEVSKLNTPLPHSKIRSINIYNNLNKPSVQPRS